MNAQTQKMMKFLKEAFWITLGLACYAAAWNIFVLPHGFVGGGFGGICAMIFYKTGIPISYSYFGFNVILCILAYIILGRDFSIKTVFGIIGLTFFLYIIPSPPPENPLIANKLLSAIAGGIIGGAGVAFYLLRGSSTGGSDIIVMIVSKYKNVSWGRVYLMFDSCVILSSLMLYQSLTCSDANIEIIQNFFVIPRSAIENVAYGFVFMGVNVYTVDTISNGRRQSVQMFIFTSKYREVADQIIHHHHRGATLFESIGWFTKQHRKTIYLVARKRESEEIFRTVKAIDENAFIAVSNVMSVFGMGFDAIKAGFTKAVLKDENGNVIETGDDAPQKPQKALTLDEMPAYQNKALQNEEIDINHVLSSKTVFKPLNSKGEIDINHVLSSKTIVASDNPNIANTLDLAKQEALLLAKQREAAAQNKPANTAQPPSEAAQKVIEEAQKKSEAFKSSSQHKSAALQLSQGLDAEDSRVQKIQTSQDVPKLVSHVKSSACNFRATIPKLDVPNDLLATSPSIQLPAVSLKDLTAPRSKSSDSVPTLGGNNASHNRIKKASAENFSKSNDDEDENTLTFAPPEKLLEVELNSQDIILDDEKRALALQKAGKANEYNPHWETPISELMDAVDLPLTPKPAVRRPINEVLPKLGKKK